MNIRELAEEFNSFNKSEPNTEEIVVWMKNRTKKGTPQEVEALTKDILKELSVMLKELH